MSPIGAFKQNVHKNKLSLGMFIGSPVKLRNTILSPIFENKKNKKKSNDSPTQYTKCIGGGFNKTYGVFSYLKKLNSGRETEQTSALSFVAPLSLIGSKYKENPLDYSLSGFAH